MKNKFLVSLSIFICLVSIVIILYIHKSPTSKLTKTPEIIKTNNSSRLVLDSQVTGLPYTFYYPPDTKIDVAGGRVYINSNISHNYVGKTDDIDEVVANYHPFGTPRKIQFSNKTDLCFGYFCGYQFEDTDNNRTYYFLRNHLLDGFLEFDYPTTNPENKKIIEDLLEHLKLNLSENINPTNISSWLKFSNTTLNISLYHPKDIDFSTHPTLNKISGYRYEGYIELSIEKSEKSIKEIIKDYPESEKIGKINFLNKDLDLYGGFSGEGGAYPYKVFMFPLNNSSFLVFRAATFDQWGTVNKILSTIKIALDYKDKLSCPQNGWVNCMPMLNDKGQQACSKDAIEWYKKNCPNYQGTAY